MFIAIVQIPMPGQRTKEQAISGAMKTAPQYLGMKGLLRKDYLNSDEGGGGIYQWESRAAAEAWYNDDWWQMMESRYGVRPTLTFYDSFFTVDNLAGTCLIDGEPVKSGS